MSYTYVCSQGHKYVSPIRLTAVSCGKCNKKNNNQNLMQPKEKTK